MPSGQLAEPVGQAPDRRAKLDRVRGADVHQTLDPSRPQLLRRHRSDTPERIYRQPLEKRLDAFGADDGEPVGFLPSRRDLRQKLVGRHASRRRQVGVQPNPLLQAPRDIRRQRFVPGVLRDVEVGLVERHRLDQRRDLAKNGEHRGRCRLVFREIRRDDDERGAEADGSGHRDRRTHAEGARLVAGRSDHAAPIGPAADRDRLAAKRWVVALLDRRVERVHVDVENPANHEVAQVTFQMADCGTATQDCRISSRLLQSEIWNQSTI